VDGARSSCQVDTGLQPIRFKGIVAAIQGPDEAFVCTEKRFPGAARHVAPGQDSCSPFAIATVMRTAVFAWRRALAGQNLADTRARAQRAVFDRPRTPKADPSRNRGRLVSPRGPPGRAG